MNFRMFLIFMSVASAFSWVTWFIVVNAVDPVRTGLLGYALFYGTLTVSMVGTLSVLGVLYRVWRKQGTVLVRVSLRSLRQAMLLTALFVGGLMLSGLGLLRWWTLVLFILMVSFIELIFLSLKRGVHS